MGKFICFNNNVSNLYNNSVVEKIYGMAYISSNNKTLNARLLARVITGCHYT